MSEVLISAVALENLLVAEPNVKILDARYDLNNPQAGLNAYLAGHIPGAIFFDLDEQLCAPKTGKNGRHPLPEKHVFTGLLADYGIQRTDPIVVYDANNSMFAAHLWWMLKWVGCTNIRVLNGGWDAWQKINGAQQTGVEKKHEAIKWQEGPSLVETVNVQEVMSNITTSDFLVLDARAPERYRGETEPLDAAAGHIPGAQNRFFGLNVNSEGIFKSPAELRQAFTNLLNGRPVNKLVCSCGSGISACHNLLALEIAGMPGARLYGGSWSEWSSDPERPIAVGDE